MAAIYATYGILVLATVGAVVRRSRSGAWRGFALLGWAYFLPIFAFGSPDLVENLPTNTALDAYVQRVRPTPTPPSGFNAVWRPRRSRLRGRAFRVRRLQ